MDENDRQDEGDSPHIQFQTESKPQPQHYNQEQQEQQSYFPRHHEGTHRRGSIGEGSVETTSEGENVDRGGGGGGPQSSSGSTPPPVLSSTTTTVTSTTPGSTETSSTAEHGHLSPSRALMRSTAGKPDAAAASESAEATSSSSGIDISASIAQTYTTAPSTDAPADPSLTGTNPSSSSSSDAPHPSASTVSGLVSIKLLVSNNVAGSIIGRSGQTISDLQVQSSSRIKLSQSGDFYPGTSDRVCLMQGSAQHVKLATGMVLQKIYDLQRNAQVQVQSFKSTGQHQGIASSQGLPDSAATTSAGAEYAHPPSFSFVVRVLVPTPCCGMLIGRGGANIKSMAESSGVASIRLSPKESEEGAGAIVSATSERIVTITGPDLASTVSCVGLVIDGMASHPEIGRYANMTTSYSRTTSSTISGLPVLQGPPVSAPSSSGAPFIGSAPMGPPGGFVLSPPSPSLVPSQYQQRRPETSSLPVYSGSDATSDTGRQPHLIAMQSSQQQQAQQVVGMTSSTQAIGGSSTQQIRYAPFSSGTEGTSAIMQPPPPPPPSPQILPTSPAVSLPALQPGSQGGTYSQPSSSQSQQSLYVVGPQSSSSTAQSMYSQPAVAPPSRSRATSRQSSQESIAGSAVALSSASMADELASMQLGASMASGPSDDARYPQNQPGARPAQGQAATMQIAVPDTLIGAILGRGGQTLTELQMSSSTRIKISQRGVFVPGTNNRVVTITGPSTESVSTAHYLIGQRLARSGLRISAVEQPLAGSAGSAQHQQFGSHQAPPRHDSQDYLARSQQQQGAQQRSSSSHGQHARQPSTEGAPGAPSDSAGESRHQGP